MKRKPRGGGMIVDAHQHVNWQGYDAEMLLSYMDRNGICEAWLLTWEDRDGGLARWYEYLDPRSVEEAWRAHPDRFVPFYAPDPRRPEAASLVEEYAERGFRGYGELKVRIRYDNPDAIYVFKVCAEVGWPVLFHMDVPMGPGSQWYGGELEAIENMLRKCPETNFIAHGPGWWRYIAEERDNEPNSAYPKGPVVHRGPVWRMLEEHPNLYADLSAGSGLNALRRQEDGGREFVITFQDKLLYGTDFHDTQHLEHLRSLDLPEEVSEKVFWRNAHKLVPPKEAER